MGLSVTFGVIRTAPATGYGYIRPGAKLNGAAALAVEAFVEKPDAATATRYVAEDFLWNSGNFMFRADSMLDELTSFEPEMAEAAKRSVDESRAISTSYDWRNNLSRAHRRSRSIMP